MHGVFAAAMFKKAFLFVVQCERYSVNEARVLEVMIVELSAT